MPSLNLDLEYFGHRKTVRLMARLGAGAEAIPLRLWVYAAKYHAEDGLLTGYTAAELLALIGVGDRDPQAVMEALLDLGFLEVVDGGFCIHDWLDEQGHLGALKSRSRKANKVRWDSYRESQGDPYGVVRSPPALPAVPSKPAIPPPPLLPRTMSLFNLYASKRKKEGGGEGNVSKGEKAKRDLNAAVGARPDYPWEAAIQLENGKGRWIRDLKNFLLDLPAADELEPLLRQQQARTEAAVEKQELTPEESAAARAEWESIYADLKNRGLA